MKLVIENKNESDISNFIYNYLPKYIYKTFVSCVNRSKLALFDKQYNINSFKIITYLLNNLSISKIRGNTYIIKINKNIKLDGLPLYQYLKCITYGSRTIKGYPIVYNIFKMVAGNINTIYEEWLNGC